MEIEVITTRKKLSKQVVKQLEKATLSDMVMFNDGVEAGYYIRDLGKGFQERVALFKGVNDKWVTLGMPLSDTIVTSLDYVSIGGVKFLVGSDNKNLFIDEFCKLRKRCYKNHLIL